MAWPRLDKSRRTIDWSWFNAKGWLIRKPLDVEEYLARHAVEVAVLRFCWPSGAPDPYYPIYFDAFQAAGIPVMGYGWPNGKVSLLQTMENWKRALGDRVPEVLWSDWEEADVLDHLNQAALGDWIYRHNEQVDLTFSSIHGNYSRAYWLDEQVGRKSAWLDALLWWLAHWIWPPYLGRQAQSFVELDALLPIDNNFTPFRGNIVKLPEARVVGWQATSKLDGHGDGGYFKRSFIDPIFNGEEPPPPPVPISVDLSYPVGALDVTLTEVEV